MSNAANFVQIDVSQGILDSLCPGEGGGDWRNWGVRREDAPFGGVFDPHQKRRKHESDMNVTDTVTLCLHTSTFPLQTHFLHIFYPSRHRPIVYITLRST